MSARAAWRLENFGFDRIFRFTPGKLGWIARGFAWEGEDRSVTHAGDLARADVATCRLADNVGEACERARAGGWEISVVVNDAKVVLGTLEGKASEKSEATVESVMKLDPLSYRPNAPATRILKDMQEKDLASVLVTSGDGELMGLLRREDAEENVGG